MQAVPLGQGAMAAIIGLETPAVEALAAKAAQESGQVCELANDNAPGQAVISGAAEAIEAAIEAAKTAGAKRALP